MWKGLVLRGVLEKHELFPLFKSFGLFRGVILSGDMRDRRNGILPYPGDSSHTNFIGSTVLRWG